MKTPSVYINQYDNLSKPQDKYWGRLPMYTHIIHETIYTDNPIYECNPEYIYLFQSYLDGTIPEENISKELLYEIEDVINQIPRYGTVPMPLLDPFFECIYGPADPLDRCAFLVDGDCSPIVDKNGCFLAPPAEQIWDYLYYADSYPGSYGIYVWDVRNMILVDHVASANANPHSVDRACLTDKMYLRTQNGHAFDVMDARARIILKSVPLLHKPRTSGDPNLFLNLQLISGKDHPMISVVDALDDTVLYTAGVYKQPGQTISGNQGGSATGHPTWLDAHHFTLLDRFNDSIDVYRITETGNPDNKFTFKKVQSLPMPTGVHTMEPDRLDYSLSDKSFYLVMEGSATLGLSPGMTKLFWYGGVLQYEDPATGLTVEVALPVPADDACHHFGYDLGADEIYLPTFKSGLCFVLNASDLSINRTYPVGAGAGHVNFSYELGLACVTNHFDNFVTIIDMNGVQTWDVIVQNETPVPFPGLIQAHTNSVYPGGEWFCVGCGAEVNNNGKLVRVNLLNVISGTGPETETLTVGGHPEQATS